LDQRITTYTDLPAVRIKEKTEEAQNLCQVLSTLEIRDPEQADQFGTLLKEVHREITELDTLRKDVGKPAREAQKDINDFFKPAIQAFGKAKDLLKEKLRDYVQSVQEANQETLERVSQGDGAALARVVPEAPAAGTAMRKRLRIIVKNFAVIPREYLCVDYSALKILAKSGGEEPPGVQFVWEDDVVVGR